MNRGSRTDVRDFRGFPEEDHSPRTGNEEKRSRTARIFAAAREISIASHSTAPFRTVAVLRMCKQILSPFQRRRYSDKKAKREEDKMYRFVPDIDAIAPAERCDLHYTRLSISDRWRESRRRTAGGGDGRKTRGRVAR